jgi:predicted acyltransferase
MRLVSLDVFRGIAIATMILVNFVSLTPNPYPSLEHAVWHGCKIADLVFPAFLFIMGAVLPFSLAKYLSGERLINLSLYSKIIRRSLILFSLGLLLNGFYTYDWANIRIMGVLQRISLTYLIATILILRLSLKQIQLLCLIILLGDYCLLTYFSPSLTPTDNLGAYLDRLILGVSHLYKGGDFHSLGDPEGIFSTLPALVTVLFGYLTGHWLSQQKPRSETSMNLVLAALSALLLGSLWDLSFPINKQLWTSSYVLYTGGWSLLGLAACYEMIEVRKVQKWGKPWEIMGLNSIFIFIASVLQIKILVKTHIGDPGISTYQWMYEQFFLPWFGPQNASLLLAILMLGLWWCVAYLFYCRGWLIKI